MKNTRGQPSARAFARQQEMDLSVGSTKTLLHNAAMVERFISMSGKHADMRFNNTDFKELLFYGVLEPQDDFYKTNELLIHFLFS